jgi:putative CocE/NonD family hydrolase
VACAADTASLREALAWSDAAHRGSIVDGIVRSTAAPDEFTAQEVDLWSTSYVFRAGHRIRVQVTSSNFPRWARNFNTGEHTEDGTQMRTATQRVAHDAARPSRVILPVIPHGSE